MTFTQWLAAALGVALLCWLVAKVWRRRGYGDESCAPGDLPFAPDPAWHEVLGVAADADRAQIETAHSARRERYLPERVARLGSQARRQAQWRLMQIDRAYATAMRELGMGRERLE